MQETICEVEWSSIRVSPFQPRKQFAPEELEELAASIRAVGLIHPPVVRKIEGGGKLLYYELIAGERRWRAAQQAGFTTLPVIVRESTDEQAAKATLIENVQRVNLNPIELAGAFRRLVDIFRMTHEEVADKVGKKRSTVANYLRLLSLPESIRESLSKGDVSVGHAKAILAVDSPILQKELNDLIIRRQLTVREAEKESRKLLKKQGKKEKIPNRDLHIAQVEEQLQEALKTKVRLEPSGRGGKLTIYYYSLEDLENLLERLQDPCFKV